MALECRFCTTTTTHLRSLPTTSPSRDHLNSISGARAQQELAMLARVSHVVRLPGFRLCQNRSSLLFSLRCNVTNSVPQTSEKPESKNARSPKVSEGGRRKKDTDVDSTSSREDIRTLRLKKVEDLRAGGFEPYGYTWDRTHTAAELQKKYVDLPSATEANEEKDRVAVAGRIIARRVFGKLAFLTLRDDSGDVQLYCEKVKLMDEAFDQMKTSMDIGDFVGAKGTMKRTEKGELSVLVEELSILTKSLLPLPDKWHGLTDVEKRYRQRYVDMIMNPEVAAVFRNRAKITSEKRRHMEGLGYLEIETPVLQFIQRLLGRSIEADEIVRWANLSSGAEVVDASTNEVVELNGPERWSVVLEFVGVQPQAVTRISRVLSNSSLPEFLKKVKFLEEYLSKLPLDGQIFERKVHQMMRRLSVAADEDIQHTLSFLEKTNAERGGLALLASAHFATARLVEGFPHIFLRDLDTELRPVFTSLEALGVPNESLGKVLLLFPPVLMCNADRELQPRLRTLKKVGVRTRDLGKMIVRYPWLLSRTIENNVAEVVAFLVSIKVPKGEVDRSITRCPQLLGCSPVRTLQPMVERMNHLGVKSKRLGYVIAASPQLLVRSPGEFNEVVNFLLKIGVEEKDLGGMLKRHPGIFASDVESVLEPKVQFLRDLGMREEVLCRVLRFYPEMLTMRIEESLKPRVKYLQDLRFHNKAICGMICRFPSLLSYNSETVLKPKLDFLAKSMGRKVHEVVEYPRYFSYSLEKKIKPRARVIERRKTNCSLKDMLALNDDQFAAKFLGVESMLIPPR